MSNSKLATWKWSGKTNNYNIRDHKIDKITIHHQAGNLTFEQAAQATQSRGGSWNYAINSNGKIGVMIDEQYRAWTSSNRENDMRAVTIEVANDTIGGNWHVSDKALKSLINLCVDICKRNGIKALNFTGDKNGNLTQYNSMRKFDLGIVERDGYMRAPLSYEFQRCLKSTFKTEKEQRKSIKI